MLKWMFGLVPANWKKDPMKKKEWISSDDLSKIFEESIVETEMEGQRIHTHIHPIFLMTPNDFDRNLSGIGSVEASSFVLSIKDFPKVPREIEPEKLFNLGVHFNGTTINTQRNFWAYIMLQCDSETYLKFVKMHSEEIRERVTPTC